MEREMRVHQKLHIIWFVWLITLTVITCVTFTSEYNYLDVITFSVLATLLPIILVWILVLLNANAWKKKNIPTIKKVTTKLNIAILLIIVLVAVIGVDAKAKESRFEAMPYDTTTEEYVLVEMQEHYLTQTGDCIKYYYDNTDGILMIQSIDLSDDTISCQITSDDKAKVKIVTQSKNDGVQSVTNIEYTIYLPSNEK